MAVRAEARETGMRRLLESFGQRWWGLGQRLGAAVEVCRVVGSGSMLQVEPVGFADGLRGL